MFTGLVQDRGRVEEAAEKGGADSLLGRLPEGWDTPLGKWFDGGAPCGPCLLTREEVEDPHALRLRTRVNGEVRQDASTGEMIFKIPELIAFISRVVTLEPGDLIATGTPSGVGRALGKLLQPGDTVAIDLERVGTLQNTVAAPA